MEAENAAWVVTTVPIEHMDSPEDQDSPHNESESGETTPDAGHMYSPEDQDSPHNESESGETTPDAGHMDSPEDQDSPHNESESGETTPDYSDSPPPLPPDVGRSTPPPTYEQCMKTAVPLSFMDFWPQCVEPEHQEFLFSRFETFDRVIEESNSWLKEQKDIIIRNCETVEIKVSTLDEYILFTTAKASVYKNRFRAALYVKGLRIWYSSRIINKLPCIYAKTPCTISYINILPSYIGEQTTGFDKMPALVEKCNNMMKEGEISGRLLNVETVCIKIPDYEDGSLLDLRVDPNKSQWRDSYDKFAMHFLRVYYLPEQERNETLHYADFCADCTRRSKHSPRFHDFDSIMDNCRLWLLQLNPASRILNSQTVEAQYCGKSKTNRRLYDPDYTFYSNYECLPRIRFLRIYYVAPEGPAPNDDYLAPLLSHKTFVPVSLRRRHHESLATLMQRVERWLRVTGATVVCAETLPVLEHVYHDKHSADLTVFRSEYEDGGTQFDQEPLLYVVRVFLDTVYPEPPNYLLYGGSPDEDEDCVIL